MSHPLETFCRAHEAWLFDLAEALVAIESPTDDKAAVDRCGAELRARAGAVGARARVEPRADAGDHTLLEIGGGRPRVLLVGHVDTVWPHRTDCARCRSSAATAGSTAPACST